MYLCLMKYVIILASLSMQSEDEDPVFFQIQYSS